MKCRHCASEIAREPYWMKRHLWDLHAQLKLLLEDVDRSIEHLDESMKAQLQGFCSSECLVMEMNRIKAQCEGKRE
jgi:hypothetical protein